MLKKNCSYCGKEFFKDVNVSLEKWNTSVKYCSRSCYWKAKPKPPCICKQCGKEYKPIGRSFSKSNYCSMSCLSASQKKPLPKCELCGNECGRHNRRFCSRECKVLWYRGDKVYCYVGENFRKDASPVDYSVWKRIAESIRERDIVCRHCGKTKSANGRALDIHHVIPFRISHDNSPSNLIALCRSCHKKADLKIRQ